MNRGNFRLLKEWCSIGEFEIKAPEFVPDSCKSLGISQRETETLYRIAKGQRVAEIAKDMGVSPSTVTTYKRRINEKLGVSNTHQAISLTTAAICGVELRHSERGNNGSERLDLPIEAIDDDSAE